MTNIYDQHRAAFANVSAYIVLKDGERIASVAFKYPRDGAGRLYAYVHVFGTEMVRGFAAGGGYDKHTAAVESAMDRFRYGDTDIDTYQVADGLFRALCDRDHVDGWANWDRRLRDAGYDIWQAV
jgi:hypothetical protein